MQLDVGLFLGVEADLPAQSSEIGLLEGRAKAGKRFLRILHRCVLIFAQERQKRLCQAGKVPGAIRGWLP